MGERQKRVLLVDDDEDILETTQIILEEHGYRVFVARDGAQALVSAERDRPDLIVLDVIMPRRSGFSVLERLRRIPNRSLRVIVVTGNDEPRHREFACSHGADDFVAKPFDVDDLVMRVEQLLHL